MEDKTFEMTNTREVPSTTEKHLPLSAFMDTTDNTFDGDGWMTSAVIEGDQNA